MKTKVCVICKEEKNINEFYFYKKQRYYTAKCKICLYRNNRFININSKKQEKTSWHDVCNIKYLKLALLLRNTEGGIYHAGHFKKPMSKMPWATNVSKQSE